MRRLNAHAASGIRPARAPWDPGSFRRGRRSARRSGRNRRPAAAGVEVARFAAGRGGSRDARAPIVVPFRSRHPSN